MSEDQSTLAMRDGAKLRPSLSLHFSVEARIGHLAYCVRFLHHTLETCLVAMIRILGLRLRVWLYSDVDL